MLTLDKNHIYRLNGEVLSSVTQILREILGEAIWYASDWYLERGQAVHACAAFVARGETFSHDDRIAGQVAACRKFFADMNPEVLDVEQQIHSTTYRYAGTRDMRAKINGKIVILDWKSSLSELAEIQVGAYAIDDSAKWGMVVALRDDGTYKTGGLFKLERRKQEFMAVRSVYSIRQRLGLIK